MKQFILIREEGKLKLGVRTTEDYDGYELTDGSANIQSILNGDYGSDFEVLTLVELSERIDAANTNCKEGF